MDYAAKRGPMMPVGTRRVASTYRRTCEPQTSQVHVPLAAVTDLSGYKPCAGWGVSSASPLSFQLQKHVALFSSRHTSVGRNSAPKVSLERRDVLGAGRRDDHFQGPRIGAPMGTN